MRGRAARLESVHSLDRWKERAAASQAGSLGTLQFDGDTGRTAELAARFLEALRRWWYSARR